MTCQDKPTHDENGFEIETITTKQQDEIKRIRDSGERLNYSSAGATRKRG